MTFIYSQSLKKKTTTAITLSIRTTWKYIKWSKSFWEKFVLNFSKTADCTSPRAHAFFGSYMYYYVYLRIKASFWFYPKIWLVGKKNKSYQVLSFDLNLKDNPKQTDTTPSTQLEKSKKKDQQTKGKRRGKRKTRPKVKPSQKSKTE